MLNEVYTGGLSSYSIVNMVMTHLLCMGYQLPSLPGPIGDGPGFWGSLVPALEQPEEDVGELLLSFLDHFGSSFNYALNAVSVGQVKLAAAGACAPQTFLHDGKLRDPTQAVRGGANDTFDVPPSPPSPPSLPPSPLSPSPLSPFSLSPPTLPHWPFPLGQHSHVLANAGV